MKAILTTSGLVTALAVLAAGCGGGGTSHGVAGAQKTMAPSAQAQIRHDWVAFFSGSTPASEKVKLLQNGQRFAPLIRAQAQSPMAKQTTATVSQVTLQGASQAKVVYSISLAGKPALTKQVGLAVRTNGVWQVGDRSFCALLGLQGKPPAACAKA